MGSVIDILVVNHVASPGGGFRIAPIGSMQRHGH